MKKILMTTVLVISMLMLFVGTAAAAPLSSGTALLAKVEYVPGKGPVFTFTITGKFSKSELKGSMHVEGGADYSLNCAQVDSSTVKCTASKKAAGKNVVISWGGSTFWTSVPNAPTFCYAIWDWWDFTGYQWANMGTHCQATRAHEYDWITYSVPDPSGSFDSQAQFYQEDVSSYCSPPVPYTGPAYYWPSCPIP